MDEVDETDDLERLLARIASGDRRAFARLYNLTSAKLFGVCLRILKVSSEAEDVLQETYVKIWQNAHRYDARVARPISWLAIIARNHALDRLRARKPAAVALEAGFDVADERPSPEHNAILSAETERLGACLDELEDRHAAVIRRIYLDGWTYREVAGELDVPINTAKTWIRRSLMKLRDCLSR